MSTKPTIRSYVPNEDQKREIHATSKGIQIVAPAGSGKTETLVHRSRELIQSGRIPHQRILILSYDNSARHSFEQKFRRHAPGMPMPTVKTINKHGLDLLKRYFPAEVGQMSKDTELRRSYDTRFAHLEVLHWDGRHRSVTSAFDALKYQGFSVHDLRQKQAREWLRIHFLQLPREERENISVASLMDLDDTPTTEEQFTADIDEILGAYKLFEQDMRKHKWMDFSDQKLRPLMGLRQDATARAQAQDQYDEIVVDECQDINRLDALLVRYSLGPETTLVVAGDDDQSLYEFHEANSLYLREPSHYFKREFEPCHLNINYRTPQELLTPALRLIDHNSERIPKSPSSGVAHPGSWETIRSSSEADLVRDIAARVADLLDPNRPAPGRISNDEIGVLCAKPRTVTLYRSALTRLGIPWSEVPKDDSKSTAVPGVTIDTMRKAKGRQWRVVVLPDAMDALTPGPNSMRLCDTESERRMFYVAMTRPSERLLIGYSSRESIDVAFRTSDGEIVGTNGASRFLFEAGLVTDPVSTGSTETLAAGQPARTEDSPSKAVTQVATGSTPKAAIPAGLDQSTEPGAIRPKVQAQPVISKAQQVTPPTKPLQSQQSVVRGGVKSTQMVPVLHDWDVREAERRALGRAQTCVAERDHAWAALDAFDKAIVPFIRRNSGVPKGSKREARALIDLLFEQAAIDWSWRSNLHDWRMSRNEAVHGDGPLHDRHKAIIEVMVDRAPELFAHIARQRKPSQPDSKPAAVSAAVVVKPTMPLVAPEPVIRETVPFTDPDRLERIQLLAEIIQSGRPHPRTGKRIAALRFDPDIFREEMLVLQLHLLVRGVRFHIAEQYRWSQSPVFVQLSNRRLKFGHNAIRSNARHGLQPKTASNTDVLVDILSDIVGRHYPENALNSLLTMWNDAHLIGNGNYPDGFKIRARKSSGTSKS